MKRKYDYIFFDNGTKERILHWFKIPNVFSVHEFLLFTQYGTYWYCENTDRFNDIERGSNGFISKRHLLYRLKDGCHKLNFRDESLWYSVENFDRFEIMIGEVNI